MARNKNNRATTPREMLSETYVMLPYQRVEELMNTAEHIQHLEENSKRLRTELSALRLQLTEVMEYVRRIQ